MTAWYGVGTTRTQTSAWRALRLRVLTRDEGRCYHCGGLGADQVEAVGATVVVDETNLRAVHTECWQRSTPSRRRWWQRGRT